MNNPGFARKLCRKIEGLRQDMRVWQENLSGTRDEAAKLWYYSKIMKAQHLLELKKDHIGEIHPLREWDSVRGKVIPIGKSGWHEQSRC